MRRLLDVRRFGSGVVLAAMMLCAASPALAATNQATDPGGGGLTLLPSATITVSPLSLSIVKEARLLDGTLLTSPVNLPTNSKFYFVIYVDNTTDVALSDARIIDAVASGAGNFTVDAATFQILNTVAAPGIDMTAANLTAWTTSGAGAGTWNGLTWSGLTPGAGDDQLDWNVTLLNQVTIGQTANGQLDIAASAEENKRTNPRRAAFRFQVTLNP